MTTPARAPVGLLEAHKQKRALVADTPEAILTNSKRERAQTRGRKTKKRFGLALVANALVTLLLTGVASAERPPYGPPERAAGPPAGGCPTGAGWGLVQPTGPEHLSAAYDFNG